MADVDDRLVAQYRSGDRAAFDRIHDRYRTPLVRYANRILKGDEAQAEDVVQEAMFRASRALLRDDRQMQLKPWLFKLTRNCALDELSRVRTDSVELDLVDAAGVVRASVTTEPEEAHERRAALRVVLGDVATLPAEQRHALLRREVDGIPMAALATEMGITSQAAKSLVFRARTNLVKQRDARSTTCADVQRDLLTAHDERRRASAATYRHLASCGDCRGFRTGLRSTRRTMNLLSPGPVLLAMVGAGGVVKLLGGVASAATPKAGAATVAVVAAGAIGVTEVFGPGEPAPQDVRSVVLAGGALDRGEPIPRGTAIVRQTVELQPGTTDHPVITLPCPSGTRVADLLPSSGAAIGTTYSPDTVPGVSARAALLVEPRAVDQVSELRVAVLCKRPDPRGSLLPGGSRQAFAAGGEAVETAVVAVRTALLRVAPGGGAKGSVRLGQPVRLVGAARDGWQEIRTDAGVAGWVRANALK